MEKKELYCYGCGAKLQTENENMEGYIQKSVLEKQKKDHYVKDVTIFVTII